MILKGKSSPKNKHDNKKSNINILKLKKGIYAFGSLLAVLVLILTLSFTNSTVSYFAVYSEQVTNYYYGS